MADSIAAMKSKTFAVNIVRMYQWLCAEKREFVMSKQILRSGTSIGANVKEALRGYSQSDFYAKMGIALKEASETEYWLELLHETGYLEKSKFEPAYNDCQELIRILTAIVKNKENKSN